MLVYYSFTIWKNPAPGNGKPKVGDAKLSNNVNVIFIPRIKLSAFSWCVMIWFSELPRCEIIPDGGPPVMSI